MDNYYLIKNGAEAAVNWPAWAAAIIALLVFLSNIYWNSRREWRTYRDTYWFERVIAPHCIEPIVKYWGEVECSLKRLGGHQRSFASESFRSYEAETSESSSTLTSQLWISQAFDDSFYSKACEVVDALEDESSQVVGLAWREDRALHDYEMAELRQKLGDAIVLLLKEAKTVKVK